MLPIVEELADSQTHAQRADWLIRCPDGVVDRDHMEIRRILQSANLLAGIAYLEARVSAVNAVRLADGNLPQTVVMAVNVARIDLRIAARQGGSV
ncbi:hypothetical protein F3X89_03820 [Rhizobium rhizogenes]|uniref:hypothetical protein n=1 Tax=Rhizobium rhizogenes TaxID=359 RepID=UPI001AF9DE6C|nr:hypothetical protein [Rhizobium rhizogenes]QRM39848.1 hypothetical protein F3X89_03820 [Rhizobium rhizogenes]